MFRVYYVAALFSALVVNGQAEAQPVGRLNRFNGGAVPTPAQRAAKPGLGPAIVAGVGAGLFGALIGAAVGGDVRGGAELGAAVGSGLVIPLGVHLGNDRRGNLAIGFASATGATAIGVSWAVGYSLSDQPRSWKNAGVWFLAPAASLVAAILVERGTSPRPTNTGRARIIFIPDSRSGARVGVQLAI